MAQDSLPPHYANGTQTFRAILHKQGIKPLETLGEAFHDPTSKIVIILGDTTKSLNDVRVRDLERFVESGGALLVATDQALPDDANAIFGIGVHGAIIAAGKQRAAYRHELLECPLISRGEPPLFNVFQTGLATNVPSYLTRQRPSLPVLASFSTDCGIRKRDLYVPLPVPFAAGGRVGDGRALILADHSVFINSMMLQTDNDNIPFAANVATWLSEDGRRTEALFLENGQVSTLFDVPLDSINPPLPPPELLVPIANRVLAGLQQEGLFNRLALAMFRDGTVQLWRIITLILTVALGLYSIYRMVSARRRVDTATPKLPADLASGAAPNVVAPDHANTARELARATFATLGFDARPGAVPPRVPGGFWNWSGRRAVRDFWQVAVDGGGRTWSAGQVQRLHMELRLLREAVAAGRLTLDPGEQRA